jgi:hypothetical protein
VSEHVRTTTSRFLPRRPHQLEKKVAGRVNGEKKVLDYIALAVQTTKRFFVGIFSIVIGEIRQGD